MLELVRISVGLGKRVRNCFQKATYLKWTYLGQEAGTYSVANRVLALILELAFLNQSQKSLLDGGKFWSHPVIYSLPRVNGEFGKGPFWVSRRYTTVKVRRHRCYFSVSLASNMKPCFVLTRILLRRFFGCHVLAVICCQYNGNC